MSLTELFSAPWWIWIVAAFAAAAIGTAMAYFGRNRALEETIRRQLAREVALKARLDDLFDRSNEIIVVHDRRGRVSTINRGGERLIGFLRDELRMLEPSRVFGTNYVDSIKQMIAEGVDSVPREFRSEFVPRKGSPIPMNVHASVLIGDGEVVGVTSIARDFTERDRLETELRQAQKMEAVGRLATGIAHDFNNLITVLIGYSDELIEGLAPGSPLHGAAVEVRRVADRASALTRQLLAFSRRQASVAHIVDLNQVIAQMEELIRRLLGPEVRLRFNLQPNLEMINADAQRIGQMIMNLAVNARDAMPTGGELTIETANVDLGADNVDVIPGPHVELAITDSGQGMSADVRDRLFEPFFTTKDQGRGTGLGVSMVQAIVRQSAGHIKVESEPGRGTTFRTFFPRQAAPSAAVVPELGPSPVAAIKGEGTVLLAEDDRSVRRLVVSELTRRGFTVFEADDGATALEVFQREKDRVDVLVTDVVMPRMNGADLAEAVGRIRPGLKVLFISGHPERAGAGLDPTGVADLLMKPFTADTLASRIKELIAGRSEANGWSV